MSTQVVYMIGLGKLCHFDKTCEVKHWSLYALFNRSI